MRLTGDRVDLGTIDILRDRERGVPRYNDFREALRKPRIEKFEDLTDNPEWAEEIREVYDGDIDRVDLQVGLLAEPLPPGFGFSDTAFRIFILMASRRLQERPLLHQRLHARRLHAGGDRLGRGQHDGRRAAPPPPRAGARARRRRERLRALERGRGLTEAARGIGADRPREPDRERALQRAGRRAQRGRRGSSAAAARRCAVATRAGRRRPGGRAAARDAPRHGGRPGLGPR